MKYIVETMLLLILLLLAALTAASETSIVAASIVKLRRLSIEGSKMAKTILKILETPEKFFGTILVANNVVNAFISSLVTAIFISMIGGGNRSVLLAAIISAALIIIFEVSAKTLAAKNPVRLSLRLARMVRVLIIIFSPVVRVLSVVTNFIVRLISGKSPAKPSLVVEDEIKALIKIGEEEGSYHKEKYRMLAKVFEFGDAIVKNVMIPKDKIVYINYASNIEDILEEVLESGYSRLPVYKDSIDNIIGVINMKDLLNLAVNRDLVILEDIIYPPVFVQDSKKVSELLKEFQQGHTHMAIVRGQAGKVIGLVTLEDLLEEIVGEIEDEYDIRSKK
ncbi:MAG: hemolysin family protein [Candidatus Omnitrophota bacterium]